MKIGVCVRAKDEQKLICDWVSHYLHLGFDRIVIYDNLSSPAVSTTLGNAGLLRDGVFVKIDDVLTSNQPAVYQECIDQNKDLDWLLLCDADEFLWTKPTMSGNFTIKDFLSSFPDDCCTLLINWIVYGTGGLQTYDERKSVFEQFVTRERYDHFWNRFVKSFVRPQLIHEFGNVHITRNPDYKVYGVNGHVIEDGNDLLAANSDRCDVLDPTLSDNTPCVLVHYMTLDYESMRGKFARNHAGWLLLEDDPKYSVGWYNSCEGGFRDDVKDYRMLLR